MKEGNDTVTGVSPRVKERKSESGVVSEKGKHLVLVVENLGHSTKVILAFGRVSHYGHIGLGPKTIWHP